MKITLLIIAIILLSLPGRLWKLTEHPTIIVDEPANLRDIHKLLSSSQFRPIDFEWGFGQATLVHYPTVLLLKTGISDELFALRLTSVILSLASLIPFFFIVKNYTSLSVAFCATLLFSSSYFFLQFSRVGWTNIHAVSVGLYYLWMIMEAAKRRSYLCTIVAAILAGLLFYTYRAAEVYIAAGTVFFIITLSTAKISIGHKLRLVSIYMVGMIMIAYPWLSTISSNWEQYTLRQRTVSINLTNHPYHEMTQSDDIMRYQFIQTIRSWIFFQPMYTNNIENLRYLPNGHRILSWGPVILFWIGSIAALRSFKKMYIWFIIYAVGLYAGQMLTVDPPNGSRGLILLPIIYLLIAFALDNIRRFFLKKSRVATAILLIGTVSIALWDTIFYMRWMSWITIR